MCKAAALREDCLWGGLARGQNHSFPLRPLKQMPIKYLFLVNKQGQTRISKYYDAVPLENRVALEADIIRKCLGRNDSQVRSFASSAKHIGNASFCKEFTSFGFVSDKQKCHLSHRTSHFVYDPL